MAEPEHQRFETDQEQANVYDQDGKAPITQPNLRALESKGEGNGNSTGQPQTLSNNNSRTKTPEHLKQAEVDANSRDSLANNLSDQVGKGFPTAGSGEASLAIKTMQRIRGTTSKHKKGLLIGGGAGGGFIALLIAIFFALIPLKIENIVNNLQSKFFATSENAVNNETQSLFDNYITSRVLPGYKSCGTTISKGCSARQFGSNPVSSLYKSWANARLENKLASDYGIEFRYDSNAKAWFLKAPGTAGAGDNIGADGEKLDSEFQRADRPALRGVVSSAMQNETKWKQVLYRYKVGRLLEEKYGIERCIIFCGVKDSLAGKVADQKIAAKLYLVQRVITPRDQTLGIALECLLSNCTATDTQPNSDPAAPAENGAAGNTEVDTNVSSGLRDLAANYNITDEASLKALETTYSDIADQGFQKYLTTTALEPIIGDVAAGKVSDAIPIAGWINLAAQIVNAGNNSSGSLKKLRYVVNASAAVSLYMMYRTYADEIHTGHVTATEVGSMTDSLGPGNSGNSNDPIVGGTAGAEGAPLYQSLIDGNNSGSTTASLLGFISPKVYAASSSAPSGSGTYLCNNGKPVPAGQLICSEESLGGGNSYANVIHDFLNTPGVGVITTLAQVWNDTIGKAFNVLNGVIGSLFKAASSVADLTCDIPFSPGIPPGYCAAKNLVTSGISTIVEGVTKWLIPSPFSSNMSGGRTFDMMAAGADVAGNDTAHTVLGGQQLTPQQTADITNSQENQAQQQFNQQSFFARIFSTTSQYSLVSRLAMDIPIGNMSSLIQNSFTGLISNPFNKILNNFGSILSGKVNALAPASSDPFGVTQYGYPAGTIPADPETYWDAHCSDNSAQGYQNDQDFKNSSWNGGAANSAPDSQTGMPVNTTTNPCMLIKAAVGSAGGYFDTSNLTQDDLADTNNSAVSSPGTAPTGGP